MIDITAVIGGCITLISAIIAAFVLPYIRRKTTETEQTIIQTMINTAVYAVEQTIKESGKGAEKKTAVREYLLQRGIKYDEAAVDIMIEAAVKNLKIAEAE